MEKKQKKAVADNQDKLVEKLKQAKNAVGETAFASAADSIDELIDKIQNNERITHEYSTDLLDVAIIADDSELIELYLDTIMKNSDDHSVLETIVKRTLTHNRGGIFMNSLYPLLEKRNSNRALKTALADIKPDNIVSGRITRQLFRRLMEQGCEADLLQPLIVRFIEFESPAPTFLCSLLNYLDGDLTPREQKEIAREAMKKIRPNHEDIYSEYISVLKHSAIELGALATTHDELKSIGNLKPQVYKEHLENLQEINPFKANYDGIEESIGYEEVITLARRNDREGLEWLINGVGTDRIGQNSDLIFKRLVEGHREHYHPLAIRTLIDHGIKPNSSEHVRCVRIILNRANLLTENDRAWINAHQI